MLLRRRRRGTVYHWPRTRYRRGIRGRVEWALLGTNGGVGKEGNFFIEVANHINKFGHDIRLQKARVIETHGKVVSGGDWGAIVELVIRSREKLFEGGKGGGEFRCR